MKNVLCSMRPSCFEDIIALLALYRPGPLDAGMVDHYINRYLDEIGLEGRQAAVTEYLAEYDSLLPMNYKNDPNMVLRSFDKVLHEHALMMKRLQKN